MKKEPKSPKDGATRKQAADAKKRAQGLKPLQLWVTPGEEVALRKMLQDLRKI